MSPLVDATILSSSPSRSVKVPRSIPMLRSRIPRASSRSLLTFLSRATAEAISLRTAISVSTRSCGFLDSFICCPLPFVFPRQYLKPSITVCLTLFDWRG